MFVVQILMQSVLVNVFLNNTEWFDTSLFVSKQTQTNPLISFVLDAEICTFGEVL